MSDETFRPQKAPITPDEINSSTFANENQAKLNEMANVRQQAELQNSQNSQNSQFHPSQFNGPQKAGMEVAGNIPPQFQQALQQGATPARGRERPQQAPEMRLTGSNTLEDLLNIVKAKTTNYEPVELPSKGKFYNGEDGPTDGIIHLRPMTGEEEEILATPRFVKKGLAINMIFNRCMMEKQYNTQNFITPDRIYLLIYLRGISYTPNYDVEIKCTECDSKFSEVIDLNALYVDPCPDDFSEKDLSGILPTTGFSYTYRISKGSNEQDIQTHRERKIKEFDVSGIADDTLIYRTAQLLTSIESLTDKHELMQLIKRLPISDVAHLRNVINDPPFGVDTNIDITCPYCMADFQIELPLEANFFFPKRKKQN